MKDEDLKTWYAIDITVNSKAAETVEFAFNELGFAVKLHGFGRPVAGLYGNRVVGDRSDRSHNVFHAAVSEDQSAEKQRAN